MKNKQAFTLIELLVVVLIIGILAAVALPQYQVSVAKTRAMRLMSLMSAIQKAEQEYYLANGTYANDFDALSIEMPAGHTTCGTLNNGNWYGANSPQCRRYSDFACEIRTNSDWQTNGAISCHIFSPKIHLSTTFNQDYWACWDNGYSTGLEAKVCKAISKDATRASNGSYTWH